MKEPHFYGVVEVATAKALLFMPRLPEGFAVWMGRLHSTDDVKKMYSVDEVHYVEDVSITQFILHSVVAAWYVRESDNAVPLDTSRATGVISY